MIPVQSVVFVCARRGSNVSAQVQEADRSPYAHGRQRMEGVKRAVARAETGCTSEYFVCRILRHKIGPRACRGGNLRKRTRCQRSFVNQKLDVRIELRRLD